MKIVFFPDYLAMECIIRMLFASLMGFLIGIERSKCNKSAGVRTYVIVAICAAIFTMVSIYGFLDVASSTNRVDISRVAHTIVTGVSFLGAGVLFSKNDNIQGLTTAASIWVMAAIGMACGTGMYITAFFTTILIIAIQLSFKKWSSANRKLNGKIVALMNDDKTSLSNFEQFLFEQKVEIYSTFLKYNKDNSITYVFLVRFPSYKDHIALSSLIASRKEVQKISF